MHKNFALLELMGIGFTAGGWIFMRRLYALSDYGLSGVLFGCVNNSVWESAKALLLPALAWGLLELLCIGGGLHRLAVVKAVSVTLMLCCFIPLCLWLSADMSIDFFIALLSVSASAAASLWLMKSRLTLEPLFPASICTLFLLLACYFCFTPFPPHNAVFADRISGQYGIPPLCYDFGAHIMGE